MFLMLLSALAPENNRVIGDIDLDLIRGQPWKIRAYHQLSIAFEDLHLWRPDGSLSWSCGAKRASSGTDVSEEPSQLLVEEPHDAEGACH
jgi:hypothetical protein